MIKKVILVFKTHFDIGFTDLACNVMKQYVDFMLPDVLETCKATEHMGKLKYVWTMPAWPVTFVLEHCNIEQRKQLEYYIGKGQVVWHALPFTSHTDFCGEEEFMEGLCYAKELSDKYGKPYPIAAKMTDVPGHGRVLPEVLAASGIRFLHLGCNEFATPPKVPGLFYWEAPSGRKVLTMYSKGGYGSGLEAPSNWELPVWMALIHTQDNCGPHSSEFIQNLETEARQMYPQAEIVCGTLDDVCRELEACDLSTVPHIQKDLADTWIHGIGTYPKEVKEIRGLRHKSTRLQKLYWQQENKVEDHTKIEDYIKTYYENMHLFGEHTWGADVKTWLGSNRVYEKAAFGKAKSQERYEFMEQSWREQRQKAGTCGQMLELFKREIMLENHDYYFYNPLAQSYTGWVLVKKWKHDLQAAGLATEGNTAIMSRIFGEEACYVRKLPPLTATNVRIQEQSDKHMLVIRLDRTTAYVENHSYRMDFDENTGKILKLVDKRYGKTLLEAQDEIGIFSYQYTRHGIQKMTEFLRSYGYRYSTWGIQDYGRENYPECEDETFYPTFTGVSINEDTICFSYQGGSSANIYGNARVIKVEVTLPAAGEEIFVQLKLEAKQETPYLESGSFCMPLMRNGREYLINKSGSVLNPREDIAEDANHVYYALEEFAAFDNGQEGVCIMAPDTPLLAIGEDGFYSFRHKYKENRPIFYFNAFNNMWGTNFPQWQGGDYTYRFVIWGYQEEERGKLLERSIQLAEGVECVNYPVEPLHLKLPEQMQLLNIKGNAEKAIFVTRNLSEMEEYGIFELPGYSIREVDYFGRMHKEYINDKYGFLKRKYALHLFEVNKLP